jgi:hypothetical protein
LLQFIWSGILYFTKFIINILWIDTSSQCIQENWCLTEHARIILYYSNISCASVSCLTALGPSNLHWFEDAKKNSKFLHLQNCSQDGSTLQNCPVVPAANTEEPVEVSSNIVAGCSFRQPLFKKSRTHTPDTACSLKTNIQGWCMFKRKILRSN